jgi:hypothetical protein
MSADSVETDLIIISFPDPGASYPKWMSAVTGLMRRELEVYDLAAARSAADPNPARDVLKNSPFFHRLAGRLLANNCLGYYQPWVFGGLPPRIPPPPEAEIAALNAVRDTLSIVPGYSMYRTAEERAELSALSDRVRRAVNDRLLQLEREAAGADTALLEGDDWDALEPLVRRLIRYMVEREVADLHDLCHEVWAKDQADMRPNALSTTISKANSFLRKREHPRVLKQVRGENRLRWQ